MKLVSNLAIIENPQFVRIIHSVELGRDVALYEDGSTYCEKTGRHYAPEASDKEAWKMRQEFDERRSIKAGDRYMAANRELRVNVSRYGIMA